MESSKLCLSILTVLLFAEIMIFSGERVWVAAADGGGDTECRGDSEELLKCKEYLVKEGPQTPPSSGCCDAFKKLDVVCMCGLIDAEAESVISIDKFIFVASSCGNPIPSGTKCGSKTIPAGRN